jgi:hypothetical protein
MQGIEFDVKSNGMDGLKIGVKKNDKSTY